MVAKLSEPATPPGAAGVNVTGTVIVSPGFSVTGRVAGVPLTCGGPEANGSDDDALLVVIARS